MAKGNERPQSFDELIDEVQKLPDPFKPPAGADMSNPFGIPLPPNERFVDTAHDVLKNPEARDFDYSHHSEVYNLCNREERKEYDETQSRIANDKLLIMRRDEVHWTKEGDGLALLQWIELTPNKAKTAARRRGEENGEDDSDEN